MRLTIFIGLALLSACGPPPPAPFGSEPVREPVRFAPERGAIGASEYGITFSPDGTEAFFTRQSAGRRGRPQILVSRFVNGVWTQGEPVPFSTGWEQAPFLTADGRRLFFSSRREVPGQELARGNNNLWVVERSAEGAWAAPEPLAGEVNRPRPDDDDAPAMSETGPVLLPGGELLYSTTEDPEWGSDIYVAQQVEGAFVDPRPLSVNTTGAESSPAVSSDGRFIVFQSLRDLDAIGAQDLYVSERLGPRWSRPRLLPEPINSPANDGYPSFSPDGRYFFFASDRGAPGSTWSIYYVETSALGMDPVD
ncbi:MAG: TolB family protein [Gemmatimonadales bacterium]